jgi:hypothetical protein
MIFTVIVLFTFCWTCGFCYFRVFLRASEDSEDEQATSSPSEEPKQGLRPPGPRFPKQVHLEVIGSETSDYEHILIV